jgi:hypothetical protein
MSECYEIKTVADFLKVPANRVEACLTDFRDWLTLGHNARAMANIVEQAFEVPDGTMTMQFTRFMWIDDDVPGISGLNITDINGESLRVDLINNPPFGCDPED